MECSWIAAQNRGGTAPISTSGRKISPVGEGGRSPRIPPWLFTRLSVKRRRCDGPQSQFHRRQKWSTKNRLTGCDPETRRPNYVTGTPERRVFPSRLRTNTRDARDEPIRRASYILTGKSPRGKRKKRGAGIVSRALLGHSRGRSQNRTRCSSGRRSATNRKLGQTGQRLLCC